MQCTICKCKSKQAIYPIFFSHSLKEYLELRSTQDKSKFVGDQYREYFHLGCIVFIPKVKIIQETYYDRRNKPIIDYVGFGLESLHSIKSLAKHCQSCTERNPQKVDMVCDDKSCQKAYHVDCIFKVKKRILHNNTKLFIYCNEHFIANKDKYKVIDWNEWESFVQANITLRLFKKQEEQPRIQEELMVVNSNYQELDSDSESLERLDPQMIKRRVVKQRYHKKQQKQQAKGEMLPQLSEQYNFKPKPNYQIDYGTKKIEPMVTKKVKNDFREEIIVTEDGYVINELDDEEVNHYIQPNYQLKNNTPQPIEQVISNRINNKQLKQEATKQESIKESKETKETKEANDSNEPVKLDNNQVSIDQLLSFIKQQKSKLPKEEPKKMPDLWHYRQDKLDIEQEANDKNIQIPTQIVKDIQDIPEINQQDNDDNDSNNNNTQTKSEPKQIEQLDEEIKPMEVEVQSKQDTQVVQVQPQGTNNLSARELMDRLLQPKPKQKKARKQVSQAQKYNYTPTVSNLCFLGKDDSCWDGVTEWWQQFEDTYFNDNQKIYNIIDDYKLQSSIEDQLFQQNVIRVLINKDNQESMEYYYAEFAVSDQTYVSNLNNELESLSIHRNNHQEVESKLRIGDILPEMKLQQFQQIDDMDYQQQIQTQEIINKKKDNYLTEIQELYTTHANTLEKENNESLGLIQNLIRQRVTMNNQLAQVESEKQDIVDNLLWYGIYKYIKKGFKTKSAITFAESNLSKQDFNNSNKVDPYDTFCMICFDYIKDQRSVNQLLYCVVCWATFHKHCYLGSENGQKCDRCKATAVSEQCCQICQQNYANIPMRIVNGNMYHIQCAILNNQLYFSNRDFSIRQLQTTVSKVCCICKNQNGLTIKCSNCDEESHLLCAYLFGMPIDIQESFDNPIPTLRVQFQCPKHQIYTSAQLLEQIYYRWHGINYRNAAVYTSIQDFYKQKLAFSEIYKRILNMIQQ